MPGLYTLRKTYVDGDILSASDYVADHQQHIDNQDPQHTFDYSANVTQMRTVTDTGDVNSESLAASLAGEIERIRFVLQDIKKVINGSAVTQWYSKSYSLAIPAGSITSSKLANGATFIQALRTTSSGSTPLIVTVTTLMSQAITTARSHLRIKASQLFICGAGDALSHVITVQLKRDAVNILATKTITYQNAGASLNDVRPVEASFSFIDTPTAAAHIYTITAQVGDGTAVVFATDGDLLLEEIA